MLQLKNKIKITVTLLLLIAGACFSQQGIETGYDLKKFSKKEGFNLFNASMLFDGDGWLWLCGNSLEFANKESKSNDRLPLIQRFDGNHFFTLKIPDFKGNYPKDIQLIKQSKRRFFVLFTWSNSVRLFSVDTQTLVFTEIALPENRGVNSAAIYPFKNSFFFFTSSTEKIKVYKVAKQSMRFRLTYTRPINFTNIGSFNTFIAYQHHFILNELRSGASLFNEKGKKIKTFSSKELDKGNAKNTEPLFIENHVKYEGKTYYKFYKTVGYYSYNESSNTWQKAVFNKNIAAFKPTNLILSALHADAYNNVIRTGQDEQGIQIVQSNYNSQFNNTFYLKKVKGRSTVISRNFSKELFVVDSGTFFYLNFKKNEITTFLSDKSIRGMLELENNNVLVATENFGWFTINLTTRLVKHFAMKLDGKTFNPFQSHKITKDKKYFWSANENGVIRVNRKTRTVKSYVYYPITDLIKEKDKLYYSTFKFNLMEFDTKTEKNKILIATKDYDVQSMIKIGDTFYLACLEGLVVYNNDTIKLLKPSNNFGDFEMISIAQDAIGNIYLGNSSGKLYQFDPKKNSFTLLYQDDLHAAIATMLFDDESNTIWLNTYKGIVVFNLKTKKFTRFATQEGFSFYESNRYASLKTAKGAFLVGTLKGLNYFFPKNLKKESLEGVLKISSISFYDKGTNREITETAPEKLKKIKEIVLAPENRNLFLKFSFFGILNTNEVQYRYRLNKNEPWIYLGNKSEIKILNLAADSYKLEIQALDTAQKPIGQSTLLFTVKEFFYKTSLFYLLIIAIGIALAFRFFRLQQKKNKQQQKITQNIIDAQEVERKRLALELHDSVGQQLMLLTRKSKSTKNEVLEKLANNTLSNLREISQGLHPVVLEKFGFTTAIEELINEIDAHSNIFFTVDLINLDAYLDQNTSLHLYRMFQEILNNMIKYSEAKSAAIAMYKNSKFITITINDSGKGFNVKTAMNKSKSLGMNSLLERSKMIHAQIQINSTIDKGTRTTIKIPIKNV